MSNKPNGHEFETPALVTEAKKLSQSPLFHQIAALMATAACAKIMVDSVVANGSTPLTPEKEKEINGLLSNLSQHLAMINFEQGADIVAGAMQACDLQMPGKDIICSGFSVGMPQKSKNPNKLCYIAGGIGPTKKAMIFLDQDGMEQLLKDVTACLDILYPQRLVGMGAAPKLITN